MKGLSARGRGEAFALYLEDNADLLKVFALGNDPAKTVGRAGACTSPRTAGSKKQKISHRIRCG